MKQTVLEMVQRILESLDLQVVNSIYDTREAQQIARIIKETYYHLLHVREIKCKNDLIQLHSLSNTKYPTYLQFNEDVTNIDQFKYFVKDENRYVDIQWLEPEEFLERSLQLSKKFFDPNVTNVEKIVDFTGVTLYVYNDRHPRYYTSFDDTHIVLDSWDSEVEHTVEEENTVVYGIKLPEFKLEDTFVPDLSPQHFGYLYSQSKVQAGNELLKEIDRLELDRAKKQLITSNEHSRRQKGLTPVLWQNRQRSGRHLK